MQDPKTSPKSPSGHHRTALTDYIYATKARIDNQKKNLLSSNMSSRCPHNMVNFGPLAAEIGWPVWGAPANFNGFRIFAALLRGSLSPFLGRVKWGPHLTQSCLGWDLAPYQVASWSTQPFGCNRYGPKIGWGLFPCRGGELGMANCFTNGRPKTKARFSCLLRHSACKWRGPILVSALYKFVNLSLTELLRHLCTYLHLGTHMGQKLLANYQHARHS